MNETRAQGWIRKWAATAMLLGLSSMAHGDTITASLANFTSEVVDTPSMMHELLTQIDERHLEGDITMETFPFIRSLQNVISGKFDIHLVLIVSPAGESVIAKEGLAYVNEPIGQTIFSIFYRKNDGAFIDWVASGFDPKQQGDLRILTEGSQELYFPKLKNVEPTPCVKCGLRRIQKGRTDGILYSTVDMESLMLDGVFSDITSSVYQVFDMTFAYHVGPRGEKINKTLSKIIREMREDGSLEQVMKPMIDYNNKKLGTQH